MKRFLALALAFALVAPIGLVGCGEDKPADTAKPAADAGKAAGGDTAKPDTPK